MSKPGSIRVSAEVKDSADQYRMVNGERYICWAAGDIHRINRAAYKAGGIRVRKVGDDLFIHHEDRIKAAEIDAAQQSTDIGPRSPEVRPAREIRVRGPEP